MRQSPVKLESSLLSMDTANMSTASMVSQPIQFQVRGRWVPGTHHVLLERQDALDSAGSDLLEVHHNRVHQLFGRGAMDPLYLTGKSKFECTLEEWTALKA